MGLTPDAFWNMTLVEFLLAQQGYDQWQRRADFRAGQITAMVAEYSRDRKNKPEPFVPSDFFPSLPKPQQSDEDHEPTEAQMRAEFAWLEKITTTQQNQNGNQENGHNP